MKLRKGEYEIQNEGIWIKKSALEELGKYYSEAANAERPEWIGGAVNTMFTFFFLGKVEIITDLLKMFDNLEGD